MKLAVFLLLPLILLAGCATPISQNVVKDAADALLTKVPGPLNIETGFQEMAYNFDQATQLQVADMSPESGCLHDVLKKLGLEPGQPAAPSFQPKTSTLLGKASVLIIRARQAQSLSGGGITVAPSCDAVVGRALIMVADTNKKLLPGGGILPSLK